MSNTEMLQGGMNTSTKTIAPRCGSHQHISKTGIIDRNK